MNWKANLLTSRKDIGALIERSRTIAVLGIKTEAQASQPAFYVPQTLQAAGFTIIPVPVYFPNVQKILGQTVYRKLADVPGTIDIVDVFRRSEDVPPHLPDLLAKRPTAVWFQSGIRNDAVAETLAKAGILVVQDRCLMIEQQLATPRSALADQD